MSKILSKLFASKKKAGAIILCTALVAALSIGTVFAASTMNSLQVKMENGVRSFSTDDGKTWSKVAPEGVTVSEEDGKITVTHGFPQQGGEGQGMLSKVEDGVRYFSTDDGKTWSKDIPVGVTVNADGSVVKEN